ncbi:TPA: hypothetical protein ACIE75_005519, partial [Klebsiella pneumoniae]
MNAEAIRRWDTSTVSQRDAFSYWQDAVISAYLPLETKPQSTRSFSGCIEMASAAHLSLSRVRSRASTVHRTRVGIERAVNDSFYVNLMISGTATVTQAAFSERLRTGHIMIVDTNEPFLLDFREGVDIICVTLEGAWLRRSLSRLGTSTLALNT